MKLEHIYIFPPTWNFPRDIEKIRFSARCKPFLRFLCKTLYKKSRFSKVKSWWFEPHLWSNLVQMGSHPKTSIFYITRTTACKYVKCHHSDSLHFEKENESNILTISHTLFFHRYLQKQKLVNPTNRKKNHLNYINFRFQWRLTVIFVHFFFLDYRSVTVNVNAFITFIQISFISIQLASSSLYTDKTAAQFQVRTSSLWATHKKV